MDRSAPHLPSSVGNCRSTTSGDENIDTWDKKEVPGLLALNNSFDSFSASKNQLGEDSKDDVLQESIPDIGLGHPFEAMGIENSWNDSENSFASAPRGDFPIPLPPTSGFDDIPCLDTDIRSSDDGQFHESDLGLLFSSGPETSEDIKDPSAAAGVCGLHNMGNTCFMGAGLQCLAATPAITQYFLSRPSGEKDVPHSLTEQFSCLLHKIWGGKFSVLGPEDFKQALGINHPQFKDYRQHDCQEFLALLLDNLHEQLNQANCKSVLSDLSTAPPTPYSICEVLDDREASRKLMSELTDQESAMQNTTSIDSLRFSQSSSHSSDSSGDSRHLFRLQPIPEDVVAFKLDEPMDVNDEHQPSVTATKQAFQLDGFPQQVTNDTNSCNNLVTESQLKNARGNHTDESLLDKNEIANQFNNKSNCFRGLEDILKDAKTSNVNVLVTEQEINNEIRFDSEKFPKLEKVRRRDPLENPNLTEFHNFDGKTVSIKRIKENNLLNDSVEDSAGSGTENLELESRECFNNIKRMKLGGTEKNFRMEIERKLRDRDSTHDMYVEEANAASSSSSVQQPQQNPNEELEADKYWEKHLASNQSIVVDTFQGQFKSTVVCAACGHVSVTYEPFMYLSVPVPHAMERQICVTVVPSNSKDAVKYLLTLNKQDTVMKLKEELLRLMGPEGPKCLVLAEVLDTHIARTLDESLQLRHINDTNRSIYAFEMLPPPPSKSNLKISEDLDTAASMDLQTCMDDDRMGMPSCIDDIDTPLLENPTTYNLNDGLDGMGPMTEAEFEKLTAPANTFGDRSDGWKACTVCLEDSMEINVRRHKSCSCVLCEGCIETTRKHCDPNGEKLNCPVCSMLVEPETDFIPLDESGDLKPSVRILNVPVLFRLDTEGDGNNNKKTMKLFGHPHLIRLPSCIMGEDLYEAVDRLVPYSSSYTLLLVDGQGYRCSRCMFAVHCRGCPVPQVGEMRLQTGDTLAVRLYENVEDHVHTIEHPSIADLRRNEPLSLYDCLQAFSTSEQLDEHNPWFCPMCQKNQCATKTLSVWRYPNFLIVYLKRFIFHDGVSVKLDNKITFPLTGLKFNSPSAHRHGSSGHTYNLYSCVCHFGDSTAGHYTAYTKHLATGEWHYFNDSDVSKQKPQEEHYNNGYVLFYQKQGVSYELPKQVMADSCANQSYYLSVPKLLMSQSSSKPNIEQLILDLDSSVEQDRQQEIMAHSSAS